MERRKKDYTIRPPFNLWHKRSDQRSEQRTRMGQLRIRQMESKMVASTTKILHTNKKQMNIQKMGHLHHSQAIINSMGPMAVPKQSGTQ
jgi:hypothetical protein